MSKIEKYFEDHPSLKEILLNILLVWKGGRKATLLESSNHGGKQAFQNYGFPEVKNFIKLLGSKFYIYKDPNSLSEFPRYFVTLEELEKLPENDEEIGKLLGFSCADHDYGNYMVDRIGLEIYFDNEEQLYAELCEKNKLNIEQAKENLINKVKIFNRIMKSLRLDIKFKGRIYLEPGIITLLQKIIEKDYDYIDTNMDKYVNYFSNFGNKDLLDYMLRSKMDEIERIVDNINIFYYLFILVMPKRIGSSILETLSRRYTYNFSKILQYIKNLEEKDPDTFRQEILSDPKLS